MKPNHRRILSALCLIFVLTTVISVLPVWAADPIITQPTGYTKAEDVVYTTYTEGKTTLLANWGARGEVCTFLSSNALVYYTDTITYDALSTLHGGRDEQEAPESDLYKALATLMQERHTYINNYQETRPLYRYTDCVSGNIEQFSSFYSGTLYDGTWVGGNAAPWNREHTWPNSKGLNGSDEDDLMMLRPTLSKENGSRGNKAYGESAGFFDPGLSVRGDVARITLYIYTRWGNTGKMWGKDGVMENLDLLLRWMQEDPVDTWEMGRNDVVESVTGVRNVFIDYPEYAWLLFGRDLPTDMTTPSGIAAATPPVTEASTAAPTEPETDPVTEAPTDPATETIIEAPSEALTATPTEAPSEIPTESSTEPSDDHPLQTTADTTATAPTTSDILPVESGCGAVLLDGAGLVCLGLLAAFAVKRVSKMKDSHE